MHDRSIVAMKTISTTLVAIMLGGSLVSTGAIAGSAADAQAKAMTAFLEHELDTFTDMEEQGVPAEELTKRFYWPEAVLAGEGVAKAARGPVEVAALVKSAGADVGVCRHALYDPIVYSGHVASLIFDYTCQPPGNKPPMKFNTIYVWERRGKEWKIIREMFVSGSLH
jgi:hypothetical protein